MTRSEQSPEHRGSHREDSPRHPAVMALLFIVALVAADQLAGLALRAAFERTQVGDAGGMVNHVLDHGDVDVIVFGSSRAAHHVDSERLERATGMTVYNAGIEGQGVFAARALQTLVLERETRARLFLLQVEPSEFFAPEPHRAKMFLPFARESSAVRDQLAAIDPMVRVKLMSAVYPFNSKLPSLARNIGSSAPRDQFAARPGTVEGPPRAPEYFAAGIPTSPPFAHDPRTVQALESFVDAARARGIDVVLFTGPRYRSGGEAPAFKSVVERLEALSYREGVTFFPLDEVDHPELLSSSLFRDPNHLNAEGAARFTEVLASALAASELGWPPSP